MKLDGPSETRDWAPSGRVPTLLSSRLERSVKGLRARWRLIPLSETGLSNLDMVYRQAALGNARPTVPALSRAYRETFDEDSALKVSFAALALALAAGYRPRILGLLEFLGLSYREEALDAAVASFGERLRNAGAVTPGSPFEGLRSHHGWQTFAADVRESAGRLPVGAPEIRRGGIHRMDIVPRRVVVRVTGGLGNQMFQYAAGLAYARRCEIPLRLDLIAYERPDPERGFLLGRLRVPVQRASSFEVLWARRRPFWERRGYFSDLLAADNGSAWLCGFWEDPSYFADVADTVKRQFLPRDAGVLLAARDLVERARRGGGPVVGVHLRRGDRGPGGPAYAPFSTMPPEYYRLAAARLPADVNFLVFSDTPDDIAWCRENLGLRPDAAVTFGDGRDPILDMFALAGCEHLILSSGTFSWWAGYLGQREGRRVVVPNPLQALSTERVIVPPSSPPLDGWEVITLPPA